MAEIDHIRLLCRGVSAWNQARDKEPIAADLSHVEIRDADLRGADFRCTEFDGARFSNVDMRQGRFQKARLNGLRGVAVTFEDSDLAAAELKGADFTRTSFRKANLAKAETFDLKIRHCDVSGAGFDGAQLGSAHFYNCNLTDAACNGADLEASLFKRVRVDAAGADVLLQARARTALLNEPRTDEWIDWGSYRIEDHGGEFGSIRYRNKVYWMSEGRWDFFISHASAEKDHLARPLADALQTHGQRVWYDEFSINLGDDLERVIDYGTRSSLFGVIVISKSFFGRRWTEAELQALLHKRVFLVLHGVEPEALAALRPELANRFSISSDVGVERIADAIVASIQAPRPDDD